MTEKISLVIGANRIEHLALLGLFSLVISFILTPIYTTLAYRGQWWKRPRTDSWDGKEATVYNQLHAEKHKRNIPTMAGLIFITSIGLVTLFANLNRGQTWLPLAGMVGSGFIGLIDDVINIRGYSGIAGMRPKIKFLLHSIVALVGGWWLFVKLGVTSIYIPGFSSVHIGALVIILFWFVVVATANAVNITDGLDGLAGGLLVSSFTAYTFISVAEQKYALAGFCLTVVGALLSYTWFNIFPARFFMGDIGAFGLGTALGIIAMQTDTIYVLPIIGIVYVAETGSVIINRLSKMLRKGKKVFLSSPIHHHFEAKGWPETKVTMRFWLIGQIGAAAGIVIFLLRKHL
ncbi:MAG TPA: phospho-N-acetylmuramoyl-pentapeptide-transferase [Candidatus Saccharimonadales bacterium]|nr:phospho-N-acetylmuramoyl-pentapeptide-transferase [Candidatus Saccharimonadales bacterium]